MEKAGKRTIVSEDVVMYAQIPELASEDCEGCAFQTLNSKQSTICTMKDRIEHLKGFNKDTLNYCANEPYVWGHGIRGTKIKLSWNTTDGR